MVIGRWVSVLRWPLQKKSGDGVSIAYGARWQASSAASAPSSGVSQPPDSSSRCVPAVAADDPFVVGVGRLILRCMVLFQSGGSWHTHLHPPGLATPRIPAHAAVLGGALAEARIHADIPRRGPFLALLLQVLLRRMSGRKSRGQVDACRAINRALQERARSADHMQESMAGGRQTHLLHVSVAIQLLHECRRHEIRDVEIGIVALQQVGEAA